MKLELQYPYNKRWARGYLQINGEGRRTVILYNNHKDRSSTAYARYLMSIKLGRYLSKEEQVDHIDNDKTNDVISNLQILTIAQNNAKQGKLNRKPAIHGSLTTYKYCKCDKCKLGMRYWNKGMKKEYYELIKQV